MLKSPESLPFCYGPHLFVPDASVLATLCVFYDKVLLPWSTDESAQRSMGVVVWAKNDVSVKQFYDAVYYGGGDFMPTDHDISGVSAFDRRYESLFSEGVLERLPPPTDPVGTLQPVIDDPVKYFELIGCASDPPFFFRMSDPPREVLLFREDMLLHILREDIEKSDMVMTPSTPVESKLSALGSALAYKLLPLAPLRPDEILEVREEVSELREGFSMHLRSLSRLLSTSDLKTEDLKRSAEELIDTTLVPDYLEFKRQLTSRRAGRWGKILDRLTSLMEIEVAPLTPRFYAEALRKIGFSFLETIEQREERLSNRHQALHFLSVLEEKGLRKRTKSVRWGSDLAREGWAFRCSSPPMVVRWGRAIKSYEV